MHTLRIMFIYTQKDFQVSLCSCTNMKFSHRESDYICGSAYGVVPLAMMLPLRLIDVVLNALQLKPSILQWRATRISTLGTAVTKEKSKRNCTEQILI